MAIEDIIAKLKAVEGLDLSDDEIAEMQAVGKVPEPDDSALRAEKAAKARILDEKKKAQARTAELEAELEEVKSKDLSDVEKQTKEFEKAQKASLKMQEELTALQAEHAQTVKSYHLEKIGSQINFMDTIPAELRTIAIEKAFGDIDMSDTDAIGTAKESFNETYASIIASESAAKGSGSQATGDPRSSATKTPDKMTVEERATYLAKNKRL